MFTVDSVSFSCFFSQHVKDQTILVAWWLTRGSYLAAVSQRLARLCQDLSLWCKLPLSYEFDDGSCLDAEKKLFSHQGHCMKDLAHLPDLDMFEIEVAFNWTLFRVFWSGLKFIFSVSLVLIRECEQEGRSLQWLTIIRFIVNNNQSNEKEPRVLTWTHWSMKRAMGKEISATKTIRKL